MFVHLRPNPPRPLHTHKVYLKPSFPSNTPPRRFATENLHIMVLRKHIISNCPINTTLPSQKNRSLLQRHHLQHHNNSDHIRPNSDNYPRPISWRILIPKHCTPHNTPNSRGPNQSRTAKRSFPLAPNIIRLVRDDRRHIRARANRRKEDPKVPDAVILHES